MTTPTPPKEAMAAEVEQVASTLHQQRIRMFDFINEPPRPDESCEVRDYRHTSYRVFSDLNAQIDAALRLFHRQQAEIERLKGQIQARAKADNKFASDLSEALNSGSGSYIP